MLEHVSVRGFRSLRNFELQIRPGINVLVGPNGAGKTNIILFFEFLRSITSLSLSDSIGTAGGIAQVFSKKGKKTFATQVSAKLDGRVAFGNASYAYSYEFEFQYRKATLDVVFTRQHLVIKKETKNRQSNYLEVEFLLDPRDPDGPGKLTIPLSDFKKTGNSEFIIERMTHQGKSGFFRNHCFSSSIMYGNHIIDIVFRDFAGRLVLNVVPSEVKKPEDITRRPGISTDGSGVSSTLYAIKKSRAIQDPHLSPFRRPNGIRANWNDVLSLIRVAVPSIEGIDVDNDPFDNQLRCQIEVGRGKNAAVVPLSSLSDGTVKWISLVLRISTSKVSLLVEEPENYLHPLMQREIVGLLRDTVADDGFSMISTHSETLLNAVRAEELIIVEYRDNGTVARRVSNAALVEKEINNTGFGLGYYYLANAVETEHDSRISG